jgi:hypothetical protein
MPRVVENKSRARGRRAYRKWDSRYEKFMAKIGFYDAQEAQRDAYLAHREARMAVAKFEPFDLSDVALKAAAAIVFEAEIKGARDSIISRGITMDVMRMMVVAN